MKAAYVRKRKNDGTWSVAHILKEPSTRSLAVVCGRVDITYGEPKDYPTDPDRVCQLCARAGA